MARKRQIDPGIWTSDQFTEIEPPARLLFIGLISFADDEGRLKGSPKYLKAIIFPGDTMPLEHVTQWRDSIISAGLAQLYSVNGVDYIWLPTYYKHQYISKRIPSELPGPPDAPTRIKITLTDSERQTIYERDNYTCAYCGEVFARGSRALCLDHIIPAHKGGATDYENLVTSCKHCNSVKKDRTPEEAGMTTLNPPATIVAKGLTPVNASQHGNGIGTVVEVGNDNGTGNGKGAPAHKSIRCGEFSNVLLSDDEYRKLQNRFGAGLPTQIEELSLAMESKGLKYRSHYATLLNWAQRGAKTKVAAGGATWTDEAKKEIEHARAALKRGGLSPERAKIFEQKVALAEGRARIDEEGAYVLIDDGT